MPVDAFAAAAALEGVPSAFAAARDGVDSLLRDRGLRRSGPGATAESLLRGAQASAALEGCDPEVAVRLSTHVLGLLPVWQRSPVQALARLHTVAAAGSGTAPGRPVSPAGVARLRSLAGSLSTPTQAPGMAVAAIVHAEIIAAAAFESYNGLIARAAERLTLVTTGVDPASVIIPEAGHLAHGRQYQVCLRSYGDSESSALQRWLLHAAAAYSAGAEAAADLI